MSTTHKYYTLDRNAEWRLFGEAASTVEVT
jgi:hypothetical protein